MKDLNITRKFDHKSNKWRAFPLHEFVRDCAFIESEVKHNSTLEVIDNELEANFIDAMARVAEANGLSNNDVHHLITPM